MRVKGCLAALACLVGAVSAHGYVLMADSGSGFYWDPGEVPIELKFGPSPPLQDGSTWNASAQAALDEWNLEMTALRFVSTPSNETTGGQDNGRNEAFFASTAYGLALGPNVAAITVITTAGIPQRNREADVIFNTAFRWDSYRGIQQVANDARLLDFRRVALHEFGHVLGLGHPDEDGPTATSAIMDLAVSNLDRLTSDDVAGVRFVYGPGIAPSFTQHAEVRAVPSLGSDLLLLSQVGGTPPFSYEIYLNNQLLRVDHQSRGLAHDLAYVTLQFNQLADFGTYRIDLVNRVGRATGREYFLSPDQAATAPMFVRGPQAVSLARGEPGMLSVLASARPAPTFRWFKDGVEIPGQTGATLPLSGTLMEDGTYEAWATNSSGVSKSTAARVTVLAITDSQPGWSTLQPSMPPILPTDLAFGNGMFVSVGYSGAVLTSTDGLRWTRRNLGTGARLDSVVFADGRFVVGGAADRLTAKGSFFVSHDGVGWIRVEVDLPADGIPLNIVKIAHGNGRFVAIDLYGRVLHSTDGLQWQLGTTPSTTGFKRAIVFGNGTFIVSGSDSQVWLSTDGATWTEHDSGVTVGFRSLAHGNGVHVGVGVPINSPLDTAIVATSTDGVNWTSRAVQSLPSGGAQIRFLNGRFHLLDGASYLVSTDGIEWEQRNFTTTGASHVEYGNGTYVAMGYLGRAYTSRDGLGWVASRPADEVSLASVSFANQRFLVFDDTRFSEDGLTWQPMGFAGHHFQSATFGAGNWVAVGTSVSRSIDGTTWSTALQNSETNFAGVAYGAGWFVAVGHRTFTSTGGVAHSTDGTDWVELAPADAGRLRGVAHGPPGFVAVGAGGTVLHSTDGLAWQARSAGTSKELHAVIWTGTRYVAVGGDGWGSINVVEPGQPLQPNATIATSTDGISWTSSLLPKEEILCAVAVLDGLIVAGGSGGITMYSHDGAATWQEGPRAPNDIWRLAGGHGKFLATSPSNPSNLLRIPASSFTSTIRFASTPSVSQRDGRTTVSFEVAGVPPSTVKWYRNATLVAETPGTTWQADSADLPPAVYFAELPAGDGVTRQTPVVVAPGGPEQIAGDVQLFAGGLVHPNGNVYDQFLLQGPSSTIRATPGRIARISFRDLSEDIVQVEFSGSGTLRILLQEPSGPAVAPNYNQAIEYMKGHAQIFIADADESTHVSVFSVGSLTAINQGLFKSTVTYDGVADIGLLAIHSRNGRFGGVRLGNAEIWSNTDVTGLWAPDIQFLSPIILGNMSSFDAATAGLVVRSADSIKLAGGDMAQPNGRAVVVDDTPVLTFSAGTTSHNVPLPAQSNRAQYTRDGVDVTPIMAPSN